MISVVGTICIIKNKQLQEHQLNFITSENLSGLEGQDKGVFLHLGVDATGYECGVSLREETGSRQSKYYLNFLYLTIGEVYITLDGLRTYNDTGEVSQGHRLEVTNINNSRFHVAIERR